VRSGCGQDTPIYTYGTISLFSSADTDAHIYLKQEFRKAAATPETGAGFDKTQGGKPWSIRFWPTIANQIAIRPHL